MRKLTILAIAVCVVFVMFVSPSDAWWGGGSSSSSSSSSSSTSSGSGRKSTGSGRKSSGSGRKSSGSGRKSSGSGRKSSKMGKVGRIIGIASAAYDRTDVTNNDKKASVTVTGFGRKVGVSYDKKSKEFGVINDKVPADTPRRMKRRAWNDRREINVTALRLTIDEQLRYLLEGVTNVTDDVIPISLPPKPEDVEYTSQSLAWDINCLLRQMSNMFQEIEGYVARALTKYHVEDLPLPPLPLDTGCTLDSFAFGESRDIPAKYRKSFELFTSELILLLADLRNSAE